MDQREQSLPHLNMSLEQDFPLDVRLARAVSAVAEATENWPALAFLTNAQPPPPRKAQTPQSSQPQSADLAISECEALANATHAAEMISTNEDLDEIPTRNLRYLLVPYLTAQALQAWQGDPADRLDKLQQCSEQLQTFFASLHRLRMLSPAEHERVVEGSPDASRTPSEKREEKIARYKLEKSAEKRLQFLMEKLRTGEAGEDDEEGERDANLTVVQSALRRALDMFDGLSMELQLLRYGEKLRAKGIDPRKRAEQMRPKGPPPGMNGMPPSFRIVSQREQEREGVFRPSHSLPTYTVEEWGEIEAQRMAKVEKEKQAAEVAAKRRKDEEDSDADEAVDRETMEAREWDEWKDEHNRGSGNTIR